MAPPAQAKMDTLILFGDSLFQRAFSQEKDSTGQTIGSLGPRLADAYLRRLDILNRGFSGYNTTEVLSLLRSHPSILSPSKQTARIVVIFLGANDARLPNTPGGPPQHVPLNQFSSNLGNIVDEVKSRADPKYIILVTPPPVDERQTVAADSQKDPTLQSVVRRKAATTAEYAMKVRQVGKDKRVAVLDLWSVMMEKAGWQGEASSKDSAADRDELDTEYLDEYGKAIGGSRISNTTYDERTLPGSSLAPVNDALRSYLHDGLHFTRAGYDLLYEELLKVIGERTLPSQLPDRLPFVMPAWDDASAWDERQHLTEAKERQVDRDRELYLIIGGLLPGAFWTFIACWFWMR